VPSTITVSVNPLALDDPAPFVAVTAPLPPSLPAIVVVGV
jgi:hypothetical protein